jgi:hypothetical protein
LTDILSTKKENSEDNRRRLQEEGDDETTEYVIRKITYEENPYRIQENYPYGDQVTQL